MTKEQYMDFHKKCCQRMIDITAKKNSDYSGGSTDPFANFTQISHVVQLKSVIEIGFMTRMSDKFSRIGSFITKGVFEVADETVEDTLLDLANYCILFIGYLAHKRELAGMDKSNMAAAMQANAVGQNNFNDLSRALQK